MKITKLSLDNFRQFHNSHVIQFVADDEQNITVVHGENGAGKTSLLNAFKWCFYGTTDFDTKEENILNERALASANVNDEISACVEVEFDHDDCKYVAKRVQQYRKIDGLQTESIGGPILELSWTDSEGAYNKSKNPNNQMNQILPEEMHSYFFFNGERIEKLAYASAAQQIRTAIRTLMGLEIVERACDHLNRKVKRQFSKQIKKNASAELQKIIDDEAEIEERIESTEKTVQVEKDNIQQYREEIQLIGNRLKDIASIASLQNERDQLELRIKEIKEELSDIGTKIKNLISKKGFLAFMRHVSQQVASRLEQSRQKGELPYPIKQQFVEDLLTRQKCICGSTLVPGSEAYDAVELYRRTAREGVEEAFTVTTGTLKQVEWSRQDLFQQIKEDLNRRKKLEDERSVLDGQLDEISKQVSKSDIEDVVALEKKRKDYEEKRDNAIRNVGRLEGRIEDDQKELHEIKATRDNLVKQSEKIEIARRRNEIAEECARVLSDLHNALAQQTRAQLSDRVNNIFQKILKKNYWAEIDDDYCLQIFKDIPGHGQQIVYEKSTGESQITSLSFIGSIVALAKEQHEKEKQYFRGGIFPIIMDSPFGSLDPTYRKLIARHVPELADQIILFVSGTQWEGDVESECGSRVSQHVSLVYHAPKVGEGKESYYVRPGAEYEYTEIEEGYHRG